MKKQAFTRRYLKLNKENKTFKIIKDEEITVFSESDGYAEVVDQLNVLEGTEGIIPRTGLDVNAIWDGFYARPDPDIPLIPPSFRIHKEGDIVDYIFHNENGKYNGEYEKYFYLDGVLYERTGNLL